MIKNYIILFQRKTTTCVTSKRFGVKSKCVTFEIMVKRFSASLLPSVSPSTNVAGTTLASSQVRFSNLPNKRLPKKSGWEKT